MKLWTKTWALQCKGVLENFHVCARYKTDKKIMKRQEKLFTLFRYAPCLLWWSPYPRINGNHVWSCVVQYFGFVVVFTFKSLKIFCLLFLLLLHASVADFHRVKIVADLWVFGELVETSLPYSGVMKHWTEKKTHLIVHHFQLFVCYKEKEWRNLKLRKKILPIWLYWTPFQIFLQFQNFTKF